MAPRIRIKMLLLGAATAVTAMLPASAVPVAASDGDGHNDPAMTTSEEMKEALRLNPGSRQISDSQVELAEGVIMTLPSDKADEDVSTQGDGLCPPGWVCFWEHKDFDGHEIWFYYCRLEELGRYRMANGESWAYKISSWRDAQTGGAFARLWDDNGQLIARTNSPRRQPWVGLPVNDKAVLVWVC